MSEKNIGIVLKGVSDEKWRKFEQLAQKEEIQFLYVRRVPASVKLKVIEYNGELKNGDSYSDC
jgi:hypothetical protein